MGVSDKANYSKYKYGNSGLIAADKYSLNRVRPPPGGEFTAAFESKYCTEQRHVVNPIFKRRWYRSPHI